MGTNPIVIPDPQQRFLEAYKNRVFQYDTKHSNLFLAQYANGVLRAVGNDIIVRGLEVSSEINTYKTGIIFTISPGSLIQDSTFIEMNASTTIEMSEITAFSNQSIILYTNWRYLQTVYENKLKIECTLYDPVTKKTISPWSTFTNRIILGVFNFTSSGGIITGVEEDTSGDPLIFEDSNIVQNGDFDNGTTSNWTGINASLSIEDSGGELDTPYLAAQPLSSSYQGIGQVVTTKINYNYRLTFLAKSDSPLPLKVEIKDGDSIFDLEAVVITEYNDFTSTVWKEYQVDFAALSNKTTILLLKNNDDLNTKIDFDSIFCLEYINNRNESELGFIKYVDGGILGESVSEDLVPEIAYTERPFIISPTNNGTYENLRPGVILTGISTYDPDNTITSGSNVGMGTQIQIADSTLFVSELMEYNGAYATTWSLESDLKNDSQYYIRARHQGSVLGWSSWSNVYSFSIKIEEDEVVYVIGPAVIEPTNFSTVGTLSPTITIGDFTTSNSEVTDSPLNTILEISTDENFTDIVGKYEGTYVTQWQIE